MKEYNTKKRSQRSGARDWSTKMNIRNLGTKRKGYLFRVILDAVSVSLNTAGLKPYNWRSNVEAIPGFPAGVLL